MILFSLLFLVFYVSAASLNSTRVPNPNVSNNDIKWLDIDHSVLVRLETPNIPLYVWNQGKEAISPTEKPSAVIINFTLSHDHSALLIQGQPFLPFVYDSIPPLLEAYQVPADEFAPPGPNSKLPPFSFDYAREVYPRDDRSVKYENYHPILTLDILGAGTQKIIGIQLKDSNSFPLSRKKKGSSFEIVKIWLSNRPSDELPPIYESRKCGLWTYRCADLAEPPWYRYVSRQDFDEYGRLGSLRHLLVKRWSILSETIGFTRFMIFITVVAGVTLWPMAHRMYRYIRRTRARWAIERDEVEDWLADEEEADLLSDQDFLRRERRFKEDQEMAAWARQHPAGAFVLPPRNPDIYGPSEKL